MLFEMCLMLKNRLNKPFIEILDLIIKIQEKKFDNPDLCKAYKLSMKVHFLKAQPIFLDVINSFNAISKEIFKAFNLEIDILYHTFLPDGIRYLTVKKNIYYFKLFAKQNMILK